MSTKTNNKQKMKKKLNRQLKKIKERSKPGQAKLLKKFEGSGKKIVVEPSGAVKMSDVIQDFAEPLLLESVTDAEVKDAIKFSILVWNASLVPSPERENVVETLIKELSNPDLPDRTESVKSYIDMLLERKKDLFPDIDRTIVDCQFSGSGSKLRLDVASSL
jgi:hypothetical protein